jgi:pilus assembly protein CpaE
MTSKPTVQSDPAPILACTISRDVQRFDLLIDDMEQELGEAWGDLNFEDALVFLKQPDSSGMQFVAIAVDSEDESELSKMNDVIKAAKAKRIKVLLIANQVSPSVLYQMQKLGADGFIPYPLPEGALHEAIELLRKPVAVMPEGYDPETGTFTGISRARGDRNGVILPVHGMAGGVGASTFAANLAWELCLAAEEAEGTRVCVIDLDLQFGAIATYLDLPRKEAVLEVLTDTAALDGDSLTKSMLTFNEKLHVLTAPTDMLPLEMISPEDIGRILDTAQANFDFVVVDMPSTVVAWTEAVLNRAHVYFALMELDLRSAQNILRFIRALKAEALPHDKVRYVLNRAPKFTDLSAKARVKRMAESLDIDIEVQLPDGGEQVTQANDHGLPISENASKNPLRKELQKLAKSLFDLNKSAEVARA